VAENRSRDMVNSSQRRDMQHEKQCVCRLAHGVSQATVTVIQMN
jgi:hypothetical protein